MKAQGSQNDLKARVRPVLACIGGMLDGSCTCMKTNTKSGQARRGLDGAQRGMTINLIGWGDGKARDKKRPPGSAVMVGMGLVKRWCLQPVRTA